MCNRLFLTSCRGKNFIQGKMGAKAEQLPAGTFLTDLNLFWEKCQEASLLQDVCWGNNFLEGKMDGKFAEG